MAPPPTPLREHRSERPAVWDVSNPIAVIRESLRARLSRGKKRRKATGSAKRK